MQKKKSTLFLWISFFWYKTNSGSWKLNEKNNVNIKILLENSYFAGFSREKKNEKEESYSNFNFERLYQIPMWCV